MEETKSLKQKAIEAGRAAAQKVELSNWGFFAFVLPIVAVLAYCCQWPRIPPEVLVSHEDDETRYLFEKQYVFELRRRQTIVVCVCAVIGTVIASFILFRILNGDDLAP